MVVLCVGVVTLASGAALGQVEYRLVSDDPPVTSFVILDANKMTVFDSQGGITTYQRASRFDSDDRNWVAYSNTQSKRTIRWPTSNTGNLLIGSLSSRGTMTFVPSRMEIQSEEAPVRDRTRSEARNAQEKGDPWELRSEWKDHQMGRSNRTLAAEANRPDNDTLEDKLDVLGFPEAWLHQSIPVQFSDTANGGRFLAQNHSGFSMVNSQRGAKRDDRTQWNMTPVGNGLVRIQCRGPSQWLGLSCDRRRPFLEPFNGTNQQLWRLQPCLGGGYLFESVFNPGQVLAWQANGLIFQPITYAAPQIWYPNFAASPWVTPIQRNVQSVINPNPPLPPAKVELMNESSSAVWIVLNNKQLGSFGAEQFRIPAYGSKIVEIERDSGSTVLETFEQQSFLGGWQQERFTSAIPPITLYDISVYEEFLQSIAIDSTGTHPNRIQDINFQPKSIGYFEVPPGDLISENHTLDVVRTARSAQNTGAVRPINREPFEKPAVRQDPLHDLLRELQNNRAAF